MKWNYLGMGLCFAWMVDSLRDKDWIMVFFYGVCFVGNLVAVIVGG